MMQQSLVKALRVVSRTDIGKKRPVNQDALKIRLLDTNDASQHGLFLVADGVGGNLPKGEIASQTAVDAAMEHYYSLDDDVDILERVDESLQAAQFQVREQAVVEGVQVIGTTIVGLALAPDGEAVAFNVGDSRIYRIRHGKIQLISRDQLSPRPDDNTSAKRNTKISSYLGQPSLLEPNYFPIEARIGDVYVLCTDGLWSKVPDDELRDSVLNQPIEEAADALIQAVLDRGAPDNLSLVIVCLGDPERRTRRVRMISAILLLLILLALGIFFYGTQNLSFLHPPTPYVIPSALEDAGG